MAFNGCSGRVGHGDGMPVLIDRPRGSRAATLPMTTPPDRGASASPDSDGSSGRCAGPAAAARAEGSRWHLVSRFALFVVAASTAAVVVMDRQLANQWHVTGVVVACTAYVVMLAADGKWGGLTIGWVVAATLAPVVAALGVMPRNGDVWSYAMYGRMLGIHHVSPWVHAPAAFPHDPFRALVGGTWANTPSVYGPAFTLVSGAGAALLGDAVLPTRLFYQGLAALALGAGGLFVWRYTRSAAAVAFLTVHPLIVMYLVNAGRNDILVGVALLAAVVLAARNRPGAAGAVGAFGALIKLTGVVGIVALLVTTAVRGSGHATRRMGLAAAGVFGVGYLAAGTTALLAPMQTAGGRYSSGSPWSLLTSFGLTKPSPHVALALLATLVLVVIIRHARSSAATAVAASSGMLTLAASYTLPGYAAWGLPVAALDHRSRVSRVVAATGLVLLLTYEILRHPFTGPTGAALQTLAGTGGPMLMIALVIALLLTRAKPATKGSTMTVIRRDRTLVHRDALAHA